MEDRNTQTSVGGYIKFLEGLDLGELKALIQPRIPTWKAAVPGDWTDIHLRPAGDGPGGTECWALAFTCKDGDWDSPPDIVILRDMRTAWGTKEDGSPNYVMWYTIGGDIYTLA